MLDKKLVLQICEEDGLAVIQERLRKGTYFGEELKLVEGWVARRTRRWSGTTVGLIGIAIAVLAWWFPRFPPH
jgi:hypothetical protein